MSTKPREDPFHGVPELGGVAERDTVLARVRALGIPVVDVLPSFAADDDPSRLFAQGGWRRAHYGPEGYARVAQLLQNSLSFGTCGERDQVIR